MSTEHSIADFDFPIKEDLKKLVYSKYDTIEILIDTSIAAIMKDLKISRLAAEKLHKAAVEYLADSKIKQEKAIHASVSRPLKVSISDKEETAPDDITNEEDEARYITTEQRVDKFNVIRKRVLITPGVCTKCGFDIIGFNKLVPYEDLNGADQLRVKAALKEHIEREHTSADDKIVSRKELNNSSWLHPSL